MGDKIQFITIGKKLDRLEHREGHFRKKELNLLSLRTKECDGVQGTEPEHNIYVEET